MTEQLLNKAELAEALGVHRNCVSAWAKKGMPRFQHPKFQRAYFAVSVVKPWLARQDWVRAKID